MQAILPTPSSNFSEYNHGIPEFPHLVTQGSHTAEHPQMAFQILAGQKKLMGALHLCPCVETPWRQKKIK